MTEIDSWTCCTLRDGSQLCLGDRGIYGKRGRHLIYVTLLDPDSDNVGNDDSFLQRKGHNARLAQGISELGYHDIARLKGVPRETLSLYSGNESHILHGELIRADV